MNIAERARRAALALAILAATGLPAAAQQPAYVAAALSKSTGTVGFATGTDGRPEAEVDAKAMSECASNGAPDCMVALSGANMCISLARATSKHRLGLGAGSSRAASQSAAMDECARNGAEGCNIHDTYCAPSSIE